MTPSLIVSQFLALFRLIAIGLNDQSVHCKHSKGWGSPSAGSTGADPPANLQGHNFWFRQYYINAIRLQFIHLTLTFASMNVNILIPSSSFLPTRAIAEVCVAKTCWISSLLVMHVSSNPAIIFLSKNYPDQGAPRGRQGLEKLLSLQVVLFLISINEVQLI